MLDWLLTLPRYAKRFVSIVIDVLFLSSAMAIALLVTQTDPAVTFAQILPIFLMSIPLTIFVFTRLGLYRAVLRYIGLHALWAMLTGVVSNALLLSMLFQLTGIHDKNGLIFVYAAMALLSCGSSRLIARVMLFQRHSGPKERVLIYGAGSSGRQLAQALLSGEQFQPVAFVDDDSTLQRSTIQGIHVGHPNQIGVIVNTMNIKRILLALPSASRARRREVLESLGNMSIPVQTVPGMKDIVDGSMRIDELQNVKIEDLLGRDPVEPKLKLMHANIKDKVVMVTGAGGSIGSELCRQIVQYEPKALILFELSEYGLYSIEQELRSLIKEQQLEVKLQPILGSVQKQARVQAVMAKFGVQTVYHAAAYKHVPLVEYNIVEGVYNNVFGTLHAAQAAVAAGVETFVLISTDKAVRPTNVMGASKRLAELVLQGLAMKQNTTRFCMVRFGNVLGSSGSVVPLFREQIRCGGPITVTHPDIIRYFMTIPEAAQLVIQAGAMGKGGDVFVLDMGEPVRIADLARRMVHLMGLEVKDAQHPDGDIEICFSGLRPGEKLYEELLIGDNVRQTAHTRIMAANEMSLHWKDMSELLRQLAHHCDNFAVERIVQLLTEAPTGFNHSSAVCDLVDLTVSPLAVDKAVTHLVPPSDVSGLALARLN